MKLLRKIPYVHVHSGFHSRFTLLHHRYLGSVARGKLLYFVWSTHWSTVRCRLAKMQLGNELFTAS